MKPRTPRPKSAWNEFQARLDPIQPVQDPVEPHTDFGTKFRPVPLDMRQ